MKNNRTDAERQDIEAAEQKVAEGLDAVGAAMSETLGKEADLEIGGESESEKVIKEATTSEYKYGFTSDIETDIVPPGLNEEVVRYISKVKGEPEWLLEFRLKAFRY